MPAPKLSPELESSAQRCAKSLAFSLMAAGGEPSGDILAAAIRQAGAALEEEWAEKLSPVEFAALSARILEASTEIILSARPNMAPGGDSMN